MAAWVTPEAGGAARETVFGFVAAERSSAANPEPEVGKAPEATRRTGNVDRAKASAVGVGRVKVFGGSMSIQQPPS
jgi:hypothetical protein